MAELLLLLSSFCIFIGVSLEAVGVTLSYDTSFTCAAGSKGFVSGKNLTLMCEYGYTSDKVQVLSFARGSVTFLSYIAAASSTSFTSDFSERASLRFTSTSAEVEFITSTEISNDDRKQFSCNVEIDTGSGTDSGDDTLSTLDGIETSGGQSENDTLALMSGTDSIVLVSGFGTHNVAVTATSLSGDTVCGSLPDLTVVGADGTTKCTGTKTTLTTCSFTILEGDLSVPGTHYSAMIELYGVSAAQTIPVTYNGTEENMSVVTSVSSVQKSGMVSTGEPSSASFGPTVTVTEARSSTSESGNGFSVYWFLSIPIGIIVIGTVIGMLLCGIYKKRKPTGKPVGQSMYGNPVMMYDAGNGGYQYNEASSTYTGQ